MSQLTDGIGLALNPADSTPAEVFKSYDSGARRSTDADQTRFDLICPAAEEEVSKIYAEGHFKYEDPTRGGTPFNWCKGMPIGETLNHAKRHLNIARQGGDKEGPPLKHLAKVLWNINAVIHFMKGCKHDVIAQQWENEYGPDRGRNQQGPSGDERQPVRPEFHRYPGQIRTLYSGDVWQEGDRVRDVSGNVFRLHPVEGPSHVQSVPSSPPPGGVQSVGRIRPKRKRSRAVKAHARARRGK